MIPTLDRTTALARSAWTHRCKAMFRVHSVECTNSRIWTCPEASGRKAASGCRTTCTHRTITNCVVKCAKICNKTIQSVKKVGTQLKLRMFACMETHQTVNGCERIAWELPSPVLLQSISPNSCSVIWMPDQINSECIRIKRASRMSSRKRTQIQTHQVLSQAHLVRQSPCHRVRNWRMLSKTMEPRYLCFTLPFQ